MTDNSENNYPTFLVKRVYENEDFNEVSLFYLTKNQNINFFVLY